MKETNKQDGPPHRNFFTLTLDWRQPHHDRICAF